MKALTKMRINEFVEMTDTEMKHTVGGGASGSGGGEITTTCNASTNTGCGGDSCTTKAGSAGSCKYEKNINGIYQCRCVVES